MENVELQKLRFMLADKHLLSGWIWIQFILHSYLFVATKSFFLGS
jgi:hypothetical protein